MRLSVQNPEWKMSYGCDACNPRSRFLRDDNTYLPKGQQDKYPKFVNLAKSLVRHTGSLQETRILAQSRPWNPIVRPAPALNEKLVRNGLIQRISANASGAATTIGLRRTDIRENGQKFNDMIKHKDFHILQLIAKTEGDGRTRLERIMLSRACPSSIRIELAKRYLKEGRSSGWNHDDERWDINTKIRSLEDKTSGCTLLDIALECGDPVFKRYLTDNGATGVKPFAGRIFRSAVVLTHKLDTIRFSTNLV